MSLYSLAAVGAPTVCYCILHIRATDQAAGPYEKTIAGLHARVREEAARLVTLHARHVADVATRESQMLVGALADYLEMPMQRDREQVHRLAAETCERVGRYLLAGCVPGLLWSTEGKLSLPVSRKATLRTLAENARVLLHGLGLATGVPLPDVYESVFAVEGGANLDTLEHIVRDRMGIHTAPHGDHVRTAGSFRFAAYNLVASVRSAPDGSESQTELLFFLDKPALTYEEFRAGMGEALAAMCAKIPGTCVRLWQRKLGLGRGPEHLVRIAMRRSLDLESVIQWLHGCKAPSFVAPLMTETAALLARRPLEC